MTHFKGHFVVTNGVTSSGYLQFLLQNFIIANNFRFCSFNANLMRKQAH